MIINKIKKLINLYENKTEKEAYLVAKELADTLKTYLNLHPNDNNMRLKYALFLFDSLLHDDIEAIEQLNKIIEQDQKNINAWFLLAYIKDRSSFIDEQLFAKLCTLKSSDNCMQSMIEYIKSWYYIHNNEKDYEQSLINSINLCDKYVYNYVSLGIFYMQKKKIIEGQNLLRKALDNIKHVYSEEYPYPDILDIEEFFNERIKGIHLSQSNYEITLESFDPSSPWVTGNFKGTK